MYAVLLYMIKSSLSQHTSFACRNEKNDGTHVYVSRNLLSLSHSALSSVLIYTTDSYYKMQVAIVRRATGSFGLPIARNTTDKTSLRARVAALPFSFRKA